MQRYVHPLKKSQKKSLYELDPSFEYYLIANDIEVPKLGNCSQAIKFAWRQHEKNFQDSVKRRSYKHVRNLLKIFSDNVHHINDTMDYLFVVDSIRGPNKRLLKLYLEHAAPLLLAEHRNEIPRGWFDTLSHANHRYRHVYELIRIQMFIDNHNIANPEEQVQNYCVVPQKKNRLLHIRFDTDAGYATASVFIAD